MDSSPGDLCSEREEGDRTVWTLTKSGRSPPSTPNVLWDLNDKGQRCVISVLRFKKTYVHRFEFDLKRFTIQPSFGPSEVGTSNPCVPVFVETSGPSELISPEGSGVERRGETTTETKEVRRNSSPSLVQVIVVDECRRRRHYSLFPRNNRSKVRRFKVCSWDQPEPSV